MRVFGITRAGGKACVYVHGVLPYVYIPAPPRFTLDELEILAKDIDAKIHEAREKKNNQHNTHDGTNAAPETSRPVGGAVAAAGGRRAWHRGKVPTVVHGIEFVTRTRFYGYHTQAERFAKVRCAFFDRNLRSR
jgi:hypothetical protein